LRFQADHARAIDAVSAPFEREMMSCELERAGYETILLETRAADRAIYLQRPDLGRKLSSKSCELLAALAPSAEPFDVALTVTDGLSATAVTRHAVPMLTRLLTSLREQGFSVAPIGLVRFGRVAVQDEIGEITQARVAVSLIGERPGLGSPDSLGAYLVHRPRRGNTDADRNCVSNIRPEGLGYNDAAETLIWLITQALSRGLSGIALKDTRERGRWLSC
jgi:ethanolamine ammonia-lyase small subunit